MAEWIARAYPNGTGYRVVIEGMVAFDVDQLESVEETSRRATLDNLRRFLAKRGRPTHDPAATRTLEFEVEVRVVHIAVGAETRD